MPVGSVQKAQAIIDLGARWIVNRPDLIILKEGLQAMLTEYEALGYAFNNRMR